MEPYYSTHNFTDTVTVLSPVGDIATAKHAHLTAMGHL